MATMTARERNKNLEAMVDAIISEDTKTAARLFHIYIIELAYQDEVEPEEALSKWYRDGVEELTDV